MFDTVVRSPAAQAFAASWPRPMTVLDAVGGLVPDGAVADTVAAIPVAAMNPLERADALQLLHAHVGRTQAQMLDLVTAMVPTAGGLDSAREEVSCALTISGFDAERMVETARALHRRLHATREAMLAGDCSYEHAVALAVATRDLTDAHAREVEALLLGRAGTTTVRRFAKQAALAAARLDPAGAARRAASARKERHLATFPQPDGMASLYAYGPAVDIATIRLAADAVARAMTADGRTLEQKRFDALVLIAGNTLAEPGLPTRKGRPAQVLVKMTVETARGLSDEPGELIGYGPISADEARRVAHDPAATWQAFLVDATTGAFHRLGTTAYRPTRRLDQHIAARDETCTFPHCEQPAELCDTEHAIPYNQGGPTDETNCAPMCRRHHRLKTHGSWQVTRARDGTVTWTTPLGLTYTNPAL